jgi:LemA protein
MKKGTIILLAVLAFFLIAGMNGCSTYNGLVTKEESVEAAWKQVENQYQRRSDLIPNLVAVVKNYADFEKSTLEAVVNARASATKVTMNVDEMTPENIQKYNEAQQAVSSSLARLLVVSENYPDLKANQNFRDLQAQLEGTENRIATERMRFNEVVQDYNTHVRKFPRNIWAGMFGFEKKGYFQMDEGADKAPDVNTLFEDK